MVLRIIPDVFLTVIIRPDFGHSCGLGSAIIIRECSILGELSREQLVGFLILRNVFCVAFSEVGPLHLDVELDRVVIFKVEAKEGLRIELTLGFSSVYSVHQMSTASESL